MRVKLIMKALLENEDGKISPAIDRGSVRDCPRIMPINSR